MKMYRRVFEALVKGEKGFMLLPVVLAVMVLGVLLVVPFQFHASTISLEQRVDSRLLKDQYSNMAGMEYAFWKILDDEFYDTLTKDNPCADLNLDINERTVVLWACLDVPNDWAPLALGVPTEEVEVSKSVTPSTDVIADTQTTFNYTITARNTGDTGTYLTAITDELPVGLTYVADSTDGFMNFEPNETWVNGRWVLRWTWPVLIQEGSDGQVTSGTSFLAPSGHFASGGVIPGMVLNTPKQVIVTKNNGRTTQGSPTLTSPGANFIANGVKAGMIAEVDPKVISGSNDGQTTAGSPVFTTSTFDFIAQNISAGQVLEILNGRNRGRYTIASVVGPYQVTLTENLEATLSNVSYQVEYQLYKGTVASVVSATTVNLISNFDFTGNNLPYEIYLPDETRNIVSPVNSETQLTLDFPFTLTWMGRDWVVQDPNAALPIRGILEMSFQVIGALPDGTHRNQATATTDAVGCRATGLTAPIEVGSGPGINLPLILLQNVATPLWGKAFVDETFTYTINIFSDATGNPLNVTSVYDRLPRFFRYKPGTTTTNGVANADPAVIDMEGEAPYGQQTLRWDLGAAGRLQPNDDIALTFQATVNAEKGDYENQYWITTDDVFLPCVSYSESTLVELMAKFDVFSTSGGGSITANVHRNPGSIDINSWNAN